MIYNHESVRGITEKMYRDYGHQEEIDEWDLVEWAGEALDFIGAGQQFAKFYIDLNVKSHRAPLPCNFHSLIGISFEKNPLLLDSGTIGVRSDNSPTDNQINSVPVDEDNFPIANTANNLRGDRYDIQGGFVVTSFDEGDILMVYKGVRLDDEGFPMIPSNIYYKQAVTSYCQKMLDNRDWRAGRIPDKVFNKSEQDWQWFCQGARSAANFPNVDKVESIKNQWIRLKPQINRYDNFFQDLNDRERKKLKGNER